MRYLREEQARLLVFLREERQSLRKELKQEWERHPQNQWRAERLSRESLMLQEQRRLAEELEQERAKHLETQQWARQEREGRDQERYAHQDAGRRIEHLERELQELREAQQNREVRQESPSLVSEVLLKDPLETRGFLEGNSSPTQKAQGAGRMPRPVSFPETTGSGPAKALPEDKRPRLGVWHPHPDDDVDREMASARQTHEHSSGSAKMFFRKHYDKYLENYQGYVELAERLHRMRDSGEVTPGSSEERDWEKRLRRVNEGIERTTARLDILEEHNPELATDDRVSYRASVARRHSKLESGG
jgi:hypothetical protein